MLYLIIIDFYELCTKDIQRKSETLSLYYHSYNPVDTMLPTVAYICLYQIIF